MAVGTWKVYGLAKKALGQGTPFALGVSGIYKMSLHTAAASANVNQLSTRSKWSSVGNEIVAQGGYAAGGKTLVPATGQWVSISAKSFKFTYSTVGLVFTASGANLSNIKYAVIHASVGSTTSGQVLCFCSLSSANFSITTPNTLTILPATAGGIFTLT